jgi:conjugative relaxase-like TrwC/TraI family protein
MRARYQPLPTPGEVGPVLNVGRLAPSGSEYYLSNVAVEVGDYYAGRGEAPGRWIGEGARELGLAGMVGPEELRGVLGNRHPTSGTPIVGARNRRVPGFDLTFRAPKSVSLLWALGDAEVGREVREAHDAAVAAAVGFVEAEVARSRRGRNGVEEVEVTGVVAGAFRHRTSRAKDPLLHTHVLVANCVKAADDGVWRTLDSRRLYRWSKTAGYLYQSQLRHELTVRLGVAWTPVVNGYADVAGVPREVIDEFSTRRAQIVAALDERGEDSPQAAQVAALTTRRAKTTDPDRETLSRGWAERARTVGFDPEDVPRLLGRHPVPADRAGLRDLALHLLGPDGLTAKRSTFDRRDVLQAWCQHLADGAPVPHVRALADALLDPHRQPIVALDEPSGVVRRLPRSSTIPATPPPSCWPPSNGSWTAPPHGSPTVSAVSSGTRST